MIHFILYTNGKGQYKKMVFENLKECSKAFVGCKYLCYRGVIINKREILVTKGWMFSAEMGTLLTNKDIPQEYKSKYIEESHI